jgi:hypothetical protein
VVKGRLGQEQQASAAEAGDLTGYFTGCSISTSLHV